MKRTKISHPVEYLPQWVGIGCLLCSVPCASLFTTRQRDRHEGRGLIAGWLHAVCFHLGLIGLCLRIGMSGHLTTCTAAESCKNGTQ